ncbi:MULTISPECIES: DUF493 family protein YbeD [Gammaproteobacteria]|uniref:DUF493 family protein YbeD n=1 Tax=Gammaproteobacteria TaxID=1236 RepID=UPI000DCFE3EB|nr:MULTISPECIES: DUF493 family protein YbeD [Gammaproteobacteria]RTE87461.1 DUF493 family protein [Aliidiomarina sp. B3213]TCZ92754.1 DUF493 family protein [Lysobacter sp. N42]
MKTKFDELLDFPCLFTYKVMAVARDGLTEEVVEVVQEHAPGDYNPETKASSKGNYHSVTIRVTVTDKDHVETLYQSLARIEGVRHVL